MKLTVFDENQPYSRTINKGAKDLSKGTLPIQNAPLTLHVPLIYIFSDKGMTRKLFATAGEVFSVFGQEFASERSRYFNHPSTLFNVLRDTNLGGGATFAIKRLIPSDAKVKANVRLWLDTLNAKVPNYKRNSDGSYVLENGKKVLNEKKPCIDGVMVRWTTKSDKDANLPSYGAQKDVNGTILAWKMEDGATMENIHTTKELAKKLPITAAGKMLYIYADEDAMFNPVKNVTIRTTHKLKNQGGALVEDDTYTSTTETFGTDGTFVRSTSYPIIEAIAAELGTGYNNVGFGIESVLKGDIRPRHLRQSLHIPYKFYLYGRKNPISKPEIIDTLVYEHCVTGTFKPNDYDPDSDLTMDANDVFPHEFYNETNRNKGMRYIELDEFNIYRDNIKIVLEQIMKTEAPLTTTTLQTWADNQTSDTMSWTDFFKEPDLTLEEQMNIINIMSFKYSNGVALQSVHVTNSRLPEDIKDNVEKDMSVLSPIFMANGQDGTINLEEFEKAVVKDMNKYADIADPEYQNLGTNCETIIYDTGFTMETKLELYKFIQERKGTSCVLSTHIDGENPKHYDHALHLTRGQKIKNSLTLNPESELYGTPAARACVYCGYGRLPNKGRKYYPLTIELACKLNKYIGPASGVWDDRMIIAEPGNKVFNFMFDIQPRDLGHAHMKGLSDAGVNYPLTGSENKPFIPALQSVYNDATSSLYSFIATQALTVLDKVQYKVWERFVGIGGKMTNEEFINQVQIYANTLVSGVTGNSVDILVRAELREADKARGFSWALIGEVRVGTMKTLQVYHTEVMRIEDNKE